MEIGDIEVKFPRIDFDHPFIILPILTSFVGGVYLARGTYDVYMAY